MNADALGRWADVSDSSEDPKEIKNPSGILSDSITTDRNKGNSTNNRPSNNDRRNRGNGNRGRGNQDKNNDRRNRGPIDKSFGKDRDPRNADTSIALPPGTIGIDVKLSKSRLTSICNSPILNQLVMESDLMNDNTWVTGDLQRLKEFFNILCKKKNIIYFKPLTTKPNTYEVLWTRGTKVGQNTNILDPIDESGSASNTDNTRTRTNDKNTHNGREDSIDRVPKYNDNMYNTRNRGTFVGNRGRGRNSFSNRVGTRRTSFTRTRESKNNNSQNCECNSPMSDERSIKSIDTRKSSPIDEHKHIHRGNKELWTRSTIIESE